MEGYPLAVLKMTRSYCWIRFLVSVQVTTFRYIFLKLGNVHCGFLECWRCVMVLNCTRLLLMLVKVYQPKIEIMFLEEQSSIPVKKYNLGLWLDAQWLEGFGVGG